MTSQSENTMRVYALLVSGLECGLDCAGLDYWTEDSRTPDYILNAITCLQHSTLSGAHNGLLTLLNMAYSNSVISIPPYFELK